MKRALSLFSFATLGGLSGTGLGWLLFILTHPRFGNGINGPLPNAMYWLEVGGAIGFCMALAAGFRIFDSEGKPSANFDRKYIGNKARLKIYSGAPLFLACLLCWLLLPLYDRLESGIGIGRAAYILLGAFLVVIASSMLLYSHIPKRFVLPIGVIGWGLVIGMGFYLGFRP